MRVGDDVRRGPARPPDARVPRHDRRGANWTFAGSPANPEVGIGPIPIDVGCTTATSCVAIGENIFGGGLTVLVSSDGGSTWTTEDVFGADIDQVSPLQCQTDGLCQLVGANELASRSYFLQTPDAGRTWTSSPMPQGWLISIALSCTSDTSCLTIGIVASGGIAFASFG